MYPDPAVLEELVQRIRDATTPLRIILFGSGARGEMTPRSDLDVLVVVPDSVRAIDAMKECYMRTSEIRIPIDIVVMNASDVERLRDSVASVARTALSGGRELFHVAEA